MKIRKARESDKERILELLNADSGNTGNDELHYELKHAEEYIKGKGFETFVTEIDGKIVGVVMANVFPIGKYAEMYNVAVDKDYRKKGVATKLMNFLENYLRKKKIEFVYGYINEDNKPSQKMTEKLGYEKGKTELFYSKFLKK